MRETWHLLRAPAYLALLALGATSACANEVENAEEQAPPEQESTEATPGPDLSGMVFFHHVDHEFFLTFHNPENGSLDTRVSLQEFASKAEEDDGGYDPRRSDDIFFAPGFGHTVTQTQQGLLLGVLDEQGSAYEAVSILAPVEEADFDDEVTYESPQFSPDGSQVWFEERTEHGEDGSRLLAVDLNAPEAQPEHVGYTPASSWSAAQVEEEWANRNTPRLSVPENAYGVTEDGEPAVYSEPEGENGAGLEFLTDTDSGDIMPWNFVRGGDGRFIGPLDGSVQESEHTELSVFDLAADGTVSDEEVLVEAEGNPIHRHWHDSDNDRVLLKTDDGYYWQEMDTEAEPELAFTAPDFGDDELANDELPLGLYSPQS